MTPTPQWQPPRVVPAQLGFLAIYNPSLGPTDDTFRDQLVFYHSRVAHESRAAQKQQQQRTKSVRGKQAVPANETEAHAQALREEENEKLRQIGLAQGMVDFAKSFSDDEPIDSIETDKSRIVLRELEKGWWILASIDLTQLPVVSHSSSEASGSGKKGGDKAESKSSIEYSSREVASPALLTAQLIQAHLVFSLHHGSSLSDIYSKLGRAKFCSALERFWGRFSRSWDVLLHGNPASDVFTGFKLASGGELGFGVGDEDWGSGERAVLEDLVHRTEGLEDLLVTRYGEPDMGNDKEKTVISGPEDLPWLGSGSHPLASDGVVFGGVGAVTRPSLRSLSLWMRQIYTYGEHAYGIRDNPLRERRKRRRRNVPEHDNEMTKPAPSSTASGGASPTNLRQKVQQKEATKQNEDAKDPIDSSLLPVDPRPQIYGKTASQDHATSAETTPPEPLNHPGIPPPIVSQAEQALERATKKADYSASHTPYETDDEGAGTTMGIPDQYMKYLTFGLSTLGKSNTPKRSPQSSRAPSTSSKIRKPLDKKDRGAAKASREEDFKEEERPMMTNVEPIPDGETLAARIALQKHLENKGHFIVGLKGDLDELQDDDTAEGSDASVYNDTGGARNVLRTVQVEMTPKTDSSPDDDEISGRKIQDQEIKPSSSTKATRRMRVLIYVHRPFMYCFLFQDRTSSLQYTHFYKELHWNLTPIHKGLLSSTSVAKVTQRIDASQDTDDATSTRSSTGEGRASVSSAEIFDLIFDPRTLTLHTSIPNIPEPGTPAAEGLTMDPNTPRGWNRLEALNVHSQILNSLASVRSGRGNELERTSKTSRGWWVVWMKIPPSVPAVRVINEDEASEAPTVPALHGVPGGKEEDMSRTAFLVRKSTDANTFAAKVPSTGSRMASGMFQSLGLARGKTTEERTGGASAGWGPGALAGGIGIDARQYVEGLLSLNR